MPTFVKPDTAKVATRRGAAVGLAVATVGVAGLIPLLDFGHSKDSNCAALMSSEVGCRHQAERYRTEVNE